MKRWTFGLMWLALLLSLATSNIELHRIANSLAAISKCARVEGRA